MLELTLSNCDLLTLSKILAKRRGIKTSISRNNVILEGNVTEDILSEIGSKISILKIANYNSDGKDEEEEEQQEDIEIKYPQVKRGDVYLCDFGDPFYHEKGYERYAIVVQNDEYNHEHNTNTIVLPCSTAFTSRYDFQYSFFFTEENVIDFKNSRVSDKKNTVDALQVRTVSKVRLKQYMGTLTKEFMDEKILPLIENAFGINKTQINYNIKYPKVTESAKKVVTIEKEEKEEKNDYTKSVLLEGVDVSELRKIVKANADSLDKIWNILALFRFDLNKQGIEYLIEAIEIAFKSDEHYTLEALSNLIAEKNDTSAEEVQRLIVARIKETLKVKGVRTISFIYLVKSFLNEEE